MTAQLPKIKHCHTFGNEKIKIFSLFLKYLLPLVCLEAIASKGESIGRRSKLTIGIKAFPSKESWPNKIILSKMQIKSKMRYHLTHFTQDPLRKT